MFFPLFLACDYPSLARLCFAVVLFYVQRTWSQRLAWSVDSFLNDYAEIKYTHIYISKISVDYVNGSISKGVDGLRE